AERCDFERMAAINDQNDSELRADALRAGKYLHDLFRPRARRDVVVGGLDAHHHVTDTSTDQICFVPAFAKLADDIDRRIGFHALMITFLPEAIDAIQRCRLLRSEEHTSELQSRFDLVC